MKKSHRLSKITRMHTNSKLAERVLSHSSDEFVVLQVENIESPYYDIAVEYISKSEYMSELHRNNLETFREWILTHYEPAITDLIEKTVSAHGDVNGWDEVSVDEMLEELHFELKEGLLNVLDSYKEGAR